MARNKKEQFDKITDEELINLVEQGISNSSGDWLNSSDLTAERQKSTLEYGMVPTGHLSPQGVSQIVSSDTVEAVEGYLAIISELMFNNNKIARFVPTGVSPTDYHNAKVASDLTNYVVFKQNPGWTILNTWTKSALLWKTSHVRWRYVEDHEYTFEEYEEIDQNSLDLLLADENIEVAGSLTYEPRATTMPDGSATFVNMYSEVRLRRKVDKSRVKIDNVPTENFRISRDATSFEDATFVGLQSEMSRSELRKYYPEATKDIDWDELGEGSVSWVTKYSNESATRKALTGVEYVLDSSRHAIDIEANTPVTVTECWMRVDRDGDGIAELKYITLAGSVILGEEDADTVPMASLCPFEIPYEFNGLSIADMIRPSTLATTAIMRGFVENVYLTNYSPKLADPNVVDFSALQNMKPKQLIPTNGNPNGAVAPLSPDTISQGTVPLLELLQIHKEQATGLSKAAQGLNDTLYVSGNSEEKMSRAMSAAQVRVQYMARRFSETGIKRFIEGVYKTMRNSLKGREVEYYDENNYLHKVDPATLPSNMLMIVDADVGEHSNSNTLKKMQMIGSQLLPALKEAGAGSAIAPDAAIKIAAKTLDAMDLDPLDFLVDYTQPDFQQKAQESRDSEMKAQAKLQELEEKIKNLDIMQREATLALTNIQSKNAMQDNARQMVVAIDKHHQEWADLFIKAGKEGITNMPPQPDIMKIIQMAMMVTTKDSSAPIGNPTVVTEPGPPAALPTPGAGS